MKTKKDKLLNRDLSWLSFCGRILQEAADRREPLYERIRFIAIFSANMDEFFRVRVAWIRQLIDLKRRVKRKLDFDPEKLLRRVKENVDDLQARFGKIFEKQILRDLQHRNIFLINESEVSEDQRRVARQYFFEKVEPFVKPVFLAKNKEVPFLENKSLYLAVKLTTRAERRRDNASPVKKKNRYALIKIPTPNCPRFITLPSVDGKNCIMFLDDVIRLFLPELFHQYAVVSTHSIKLSRDAELYIDDEFSGNLLEKIRKALSKRHQGIPTRFLYDEAMPKKLLKMLRKAFSLSEEDFVRGGRYHNSSDFFEFPNPLAPALRSKPLEQLPHNVLESARSLFDPVSRQDILLHYPYQSFGYVLRFLQEAAADPAVNAIKITLYRVAQQSRVVQHLVEAASRGKSVTAFVEIKARFDEALNIRWAEELERAGVKVIYSFPGLKVHGKLCLVSRREREGKRHVTKQYAYLGTGNFNEVTAETYADFGFFTSDDRLTNEVEQLFDYLSGKRKKVRFEHLLVAPFTMQQRIMKLIDREIKNHNKGKKARIVAKMNGLEDPAIIEKLYQASNAGVDVQLIVRGICCLVPGVKKLSKNIDVVSIVDRFLEHGRVYTFQNGGKERVYLSSADWMVRNMSRRIEVAFPIYAEPLKKELRACLNIQLADTTKARIIDKKSSNEYKRGDGGRGIRTQTDTYALLKQYHEKIHHLDRARVARSS